MSFITIREASDLLHLNRTSILRLIQQGKVSGRQAEWRGHGIIWQVDADSLLRHYGRQEPAQKPRFTSNRDSLHDEITLRQARIKHLQHEISILEEEIGMRQQLLRLTRT